LLDSRSTSRQVTYQVDVSGVRVDVHQKEDDSACQVRVDTVDDDFATNINYLHVAQALVFDRLVGLGVMANTVFEVLSLRLEQV
jgi:hypothetical protein